MMMNLPHRRIDLSHINSLEDIDLEIRLVKRRVRAREVELKEDFKAIPREAVKASLGSISPMFKKARVADQAFASIQTLVGGIVASIIEGKRSGKGFKKGLATTLKQLSFLGTAKAVIQLFSKRKAARESMTGEGV